MAFQRTFTFLGTGTSVGVPMLGCNCAVCRSTDPRNHRYRCSVLISTTRGRILIDTPPELRLQLLRANVGFVHAVLFTHYHADHLFGLDDLRPMPRQLGGAVPLYCTADTEGKIRQSFSYAFGPAAADLPAGFIPKLTFRRITTEPFEVLGEQVLPVLLEHAHFEVYGFRIGDVAYCTDVSKIPQGSWSRLEGLRVLIIDALRPAPHPAHFGLEEAMDAINKVRPKQAYFTHMSHEFDHETLSRQLPPNVQPAYDGLSFEF
jgi:phosphoribosyl 1,2-cyclic phosphate phosphodiesterase